MIMNSINITSVKKIAQYQLRLVFDDGTVREVDFKDFLAQSHHPDIRAYLEESKFDAYHLEFGELVWGDFDLRGGASRRGNPAATALSAAINPNKQTAHS
jgi:hypothetical protein